MIIGGSKKEVIKNIEKNLKNNELNKKVELNDPVLTEEESMNIVNKFYNLRNNKVLFFFKSTFANIYVDILSYMLNGSIKIEGMENLIGINDGAIVTSNHFNPLDNLIIRSLIKKRYKKNVFIVSQETNLAMPGIIGFLINHLNIIPLAKSPSFLINTFKPKLKEALDNGNYVLIYPEEEMWFNYKKPRPCKKGAYRFASEFDKPIISCFVEQVSTSKKDNDEFNKVKYIVHILPPIFPDKNKSDRENSSWMSIEDYKQKWECYEKVYGEELTYDFKIGDIAGFNEN